MDKITAMLEKEWHEAVKNKMVLLTGILLPVLFVALPLGTLAATRNIETAEAEMNDAPPGMLNNPAFAGMSDQEMIQGFLINQFMTLFLLVPLAIPMTIATYSIVGEKREKSLEPLLATPITIPELLFAKSLAAALPGVLASWLSFAIYIVGARFLVISDRVYSFVINPMWIVSLLFVAPLLTVLAVNVGLMVSSRVNDPRAAEQMGMIIILPVLGLLFAQMAGVLFLGLNLVMALIGALVLIDGALIYFGAKLFQRETILTRWR